MMIFFMGTLATLLCLVAVLFLFIKFYFRYNAKVLQAQVIGIEKYINKSHSRNRGSSLMYRPLIEYIFKGKKYKFFGHGRNEISYKIGKSVKVLSLKYGPEYVILDSQILNIFGYIFLAFGVFMQYQFFNSELDMQMKLAYLLIYMSILIFGYFQLKKEKLLKIFKDGLLRTNLETKESLLNRDIFYTNKNISSEQRKNAKIGLVITSIFTIFTYSFMAFCWNTISSSQKELLISVTTDMSKISEVIQLSKATPHLIGVLIPIIFIPLLIHSFLYSFRKL